MSENGTTTTTAITTIADEAMDLQAVLRQAQRIQQVMTAVMKDGEHYGVIPGTSGKKSLLKPGAEKICLVFGLSNKLEITVDNLPGGHREYRIICNLYDRSGNLRGQGVGSASTMESKHRYRGAAGKACPSCGCMACKASKKEWGGGYYCDAKAGGCNARYKPGSQEAKALDAVPAMRAENPDPADQYNTVLKMAKKRALVDAVLTATAASDIFAQDLEDLDDKLGADDDHPAVADAKPVTPTADTTKPVRAPRSKAAPAPAAPPAANGNGNGNGRHPSILALQDLYRRLGAVDKARAGKVYDRICKLFGAKAAPEIAAEKLEALGNAVYELSKSEGDIETVLDAWEQDMAEAHAAGATEEG